MSINDGDHRLDDKVKRYLSSVEVEPLQPPFSAPWRKISMTDGTVLALSITDARKVEWLLNAKMADQEITLSPIDGDDKRIRISIGAEE